MNCDGKSYMRSNGLVSFSAFAFIWPSGRKSCPSCRIVPRPPYVKYTCHMGHGLERASLHRGLIEEFDTLDEGRALTAACRFGGVYHKGSRVAISVAIAPGDQPQ